MSEKREIKMVFKEGEKWAEENIKEMINSGWELIGFSVGETDDGWWFWMVYQKTNNAKR